MSGPVKTRLVAVKCNAKGCPVGQFASKAKHPDSIVERARELFAQGIGPSAIGKILGVPRETARNWARGTRRNVKAVRTIMRRVPVKDAA